ncbi:MAG TPA: DUF3822 family protein [Bacteroidales bacterium]|nr:DUF3822 family protein [Bacteroidales bacterium]
MPFIELFDETLDINSTENYDLSLQAGTDALTFCILDTIRNKYVMLRSWEAEEGNFLKITDTEEFISKDDFLGRQYRKINIILPSGKLTLVPGPLFDPGKKDEYFSFNHKIEEGEVILSNRNADPDSYLVFSVPASLYTLISGRFPGTLPYNHTKPLLHHISHERKGTEGNYIHLHIERDYINLIIFSGDTLKFCNSFTYRSISDILYYVLNTFRSLGIKQEETIILSGITEKYDELSTAFSSYIRKLKYATPAGRFTFSYVFNETVLHRYINLFTAATCE